MKDVLKQLFAKFTTTAKKEENPKQNKQKSTSEELIKRTDIPDTPFTVISIEGLSFFGTMGKYRITENYKTFDECKNDLEKITWNRIAQICILINESNKEK